MKQAKPAIFHGDYELVSLADDENEPYRQAFLVEDGLLIGIGPVVTVEQQISRLPESRVELLDMLRERARKSGSKGIHKLVWTVLGLPYGDWQEGFDRLQIERAEKQQSRERAERESQEKEREATETKQAEVAAAVMAGERVSGEDLVALARAIAVDVNPRTAGVLIKKVAWISPTGASVRGGTGSQLMFQVYAAVQRTLLAHAPA